MPVVKKYTEQSILVNKNISEVVRYEWRRVVVIGTGFNKHYQHDISG